MSRAVSSTEGSGSNGRGGTIRAEFGDKLDTDVQAILRHLEARCAVSDCGVERQDHHVGFDHPFVEPCRRLRARNGRLSRVVRLVRVRWSNRGSRA